MRDHRLGRKPTYLPYSNYFNWRKSRAEQHWGKPAVAPNSKFKT